MADNPSDKNNIPDSPQYTGGWRKPQTTTTAPVKPSTAETGGWRVPVLPTNLSEAPADVGQWHLPRPEDTSFSEEDETEITPERQQSIQERPEDFLLSLAT